MSHKSGETEGSRVEGSAVIPNANVDFCAYPDCVVCVLLCPAESELPAAPEGLPHPESINVIAAAQSSAASLVAIFSLPFLPVHLFSLAKLQANHYTYK